MCSFRHALALSLALWLCAASLSLAVENKAGGRVTVIADGKSDYSIVVPSGPDERNRVGAAATLLQGYLTSATGVKLPIVKESALPKGSHAIYLGMTQAARDAGLPVEKLNRWSYIKRTVGENIFIVGKDVSAGVTDRYRFDNQGYAPEEPLGAEKCAGVEYLATKKAVLSFLDEEVGIKFLLQGEKYGTSVPKLDSLTVDSSLNVFFTPAFSYVNGIATNSLYHMANNFLGGEHFWTYGGHSYSDAVPVPKYGKTHPEYYVLRNGRRETEGNHLCVSNPEVFSLLVKEAQKRLDAGYEWVEVGQTDGLTPCECEPCKAIHPNVGERLWIVHRKLAEEVRKSHPTKKVMLLAYADTQNPPKTFNTFPDNVIIQMCKYSPEDFTRWARFDLPKTVYSYDWGTYGPTGIAPKHSPRWAAERIRYMVDNKVVGQYLCGAFESPALEGPTYYVYGKLMGDPTLNYNELVEDYYRAAFGKARAPMKSFFTGFYRQMDLITRLLPTPAEAFPQLLPAKLIVEMDQNLARAKTLAADDPAVLSRLKMVEVEYEYCRNLAAIYHHYQSYLLSPTWGTFEPMAEAIDRRTAFINQWTNPDGSAKRFDGWPPVLGGANRDFLKVGGFMSAILSAPVNWNTKLLREKKLLPGAGQKTAKVSPIQNVNFDGKIDDLAWQAVPKQDLGEISLNELKNNSWFKIAYDEKYLYFAFEGEVDDETVLKFAPTGRDGSAFGYECFELFIDPFGDREKYYHFIFNHLPDSFYDGRKGFIDDPVHPMYNREDRTWNGQWEYKGSVDTTGKKWTAEVRIPFATLGVETPRPGTKWSLNVGREEYPSKPMLPGTREPNLSLWSPNLEGQDFSSFAAMGTLIFE